MKVGKTCTKCGVLKSRDEFNRQTASKDGLRPWCKTCDRATGRERYHRYVADPQRRAELFERILERRAQEPEKRKARQHINNAIRRGKLVRPSQCEECGQVGRVDAHHDDYSKPLEVRWLCRICHLGLHRSEAA